MTIFKIEVRNSLKGFYLWLIIFIAMIVGFTALYPQMVSTEMKDSLNQLMNGFSPELLKIFNIELTGPASLLSPTGFFAYYFQYMFLAACIYAVLSGSNSLITEETDGTIDFLYAQPVTRSEILFGKISARVSLLTSFWGGSLLSALGSVLFFKQSDDSSQVIVEEISRIFVAQYLILFFFLSLGFLISACVKSNKVTTGIGLGIVFGLYLLGMVGEMIDKVSWLGTYSPVTMGLPTNIINQGLRFAGILLFLTVGLLGLSWFVYQRKDLQS